MRGARRALLAVLLLPVLLLAAAPARAGEAPTRTAAVILLPSMSYEEALAWPPLRRLAVAGGVGLMTTPPAADRTPEETLVDGGAPAGTLERLADEGELAVVRVRDAGELEEALRAVLATDLEEALVVAAPPRPSPAMEERGDAVTPLFVARGAPADLRDPSGAVGGLASVTTRREGLVANLDVAPTVLAFLSRPVPQEMPGAPVRVEGGAPGLLHERYLAVRELRVPVQVATLALALAALAGGVAFVVGGRRSPAVARALAVAGLAAVALPAAALPASDLPRIAWGTVLPAALLVAALMVGAGVWWGRRDPTVPVAVVAAASASILLVDAAWGWRASMMPLFGGSAFEGARFFGLGNIYAGDLLAGAVLTAAHLPPRWGVGLLIGSALFAGLPWLGTNLGASLTLFSAAGLWYGLRVRRRMGWREVAAAAGVTVLGTAAVVAVHGLLAAGDTHVARLTEEATRTGLPAVVDALARRVAIGVRVTSQVPVAWLLLAALPAVAVLAWRRWGHLRRDPPWRDAVFVLCVAGLVGFVANDTGIGVGGVAFAFAAVALGYPALEERWTSP